jgi:hypothetical protein
MCGEKTICKICNKGNEEGNVGFRYRVQTDDYVHIECQRVPERVEQKGTFPFTTTHFDANKPVTVQSLRHLRQLENKHGVQSVAYNQNSSNW